MFPGVRTSLRLLRHPAPAVNLCSLRAVQGLDRALEESQAQLAARASSVAAREAACAASERQLAARLAQLSLHERALQERTARLAALEHDVQARSMLRWCTSVAESSAEVALAVFQIRCWRHEL